MKNLPEKLQKLVDAAHTATPSKDAAAVGLHSLDLTSLNDDDTPEKIDALTKKADQGKLGHVAATCVYPQFLTQVFNATAKKGINNATVLNFPSGTGAVEQTYMDTKKAILSGANEVDIVLDYNSFLKGGDAHAKELLDACRAASQGFAKMKVILESAAFDDYRDLSAASRLALASGADFIKTSTGKSPAGGASLEAAATMLEAIIDTGSHAGLKVSGGVKSVTDVAQYVALSKSMMGDNWISTNTFRIGASGVLTDILKTLGQATAPAAPSAPGY
jgi:deoxyribose-phosphate aldolase